MNYVQEIADLFLSLKPDKKILDAGDYSIIAEWEKEEIPLSLVRDSIQEVRDKLPNDKLELDCLGCVNRTVIQNFETWLQKASLG